MTQHFRFACGIAAACLPLMAMPGLVSRTAVAESNFDRAAYAGRAAEHHGDAGRGDRLVHDTKRTTCLRCHKIGDQGSEAGPNLSNVGGKLGREHLVESILEPSRQIVEGFRGIVVVTKAGKVVSGFAPSEGDGVLKFIDVNGEPVALPINEIDERKSMSDSPMPERLAATLSADEFCDVVAYLETLRAAGQSSPGSGLQGAPSLPPEFEWQTVVTGLTGATALAAASDGRVFVCEQTGTLRVVKDDCLLADSCLRLAVDDEWERGLIGITVDPQ